MKLKNLQLILVGILFCTATVFANVQINERGNFRESEMNAELFSLREHTKPEIGRNRTPISTRQSNATTHRLDSIVFCRGSWYNYKGRYEFEYDNNGNMTMWIIYHMGITDEQESEWRENLKTKYAYDNNGNRTTMIYSYWVNNEWSEEEKYEYVYDNNGNMTAEIRYVWGNNVWREHWKYEYVYDSNGNITTWNIYPWYRDNMWIIDWKTEYLYDSNGNMIMETRYVWSYNVWREVGFKWEYAYDGNGNMTADIQYRWRNNAWEKERKYESVYDSNGNEITWIRSRWENNAWEENMKREYEYDGNGNQTTGILYWWLNDAWRQDAKAEFVYDTNGNTVAQTHYGWHSNEWVEEFKVEYEFDLSASMSDVFWSEEDIWQNTELAHTWQGLGVFFEANNVFVNKLTGIKRTTWTQPDQDFTFYYSQVPTNIPNISENSFTIFPNPVFENFTISGITENTLVSITDLNGRIVLQQVISPNEQVSVGHLSAGVYFVRVNEEAVKIVKR